MGWILQVHPIDAHFWKKYKENFSLKGPVIIYVERGREKKKTGVKAILDWLEGRLNFFIKKFKRGQQFYRQVYFKKGQLAKMGKVVIL